MNSATNHVGNIGVNEVKTNDGEADGSVNQLKNLNPAKSGMKELCIMCNSEVEEAGRCGFPNCIDKHKFCLMCFTEIIKRISKDDIEKALLRCPVDKEGDIFVILCNERIQFYYHMCYLDALEYLDDELTQRVLSTDSVRYKEMLGTLRRTRKLPLDVCFECFRDISEFSHHYGYSYCCRVHRFCMRCVLNKESCCCPIPGFHMGGSVVSVVKGDTLYDPGYEDIEYLKPLSNVDLTEETEENLEIRKEFERRHTEEYLSENSEFSIAL